MSYSVKGTIEAIYLEREIGKTGRKQDVVISFPGPKKNLYARLVANDEVCDKIKRFKVGQTVHMEFELTGYKFRRPGDDEYQFGNELNIVNIYKL